MKFVVLFVTALISAPVLYGFETTEMPELESLFRNTDPWLGGDAVYSLDISQFHENKVLWFFGDTLWGKIEDGKKVWDAIPNNSLALMDRKNKTAEFFPEGENFFALPEWLENKDLWGPWPFAPFIYDNKVYCFLMVIDPEEFSKASGNWLADVYLAEISNPYENVREWSAKYMPIPHLPIRYDNNSYLWTATDVYVENGTCYIYGLRQDNVDGGVLRHLVIARTRDVKGGWDFYDGRGWSREPCIVEGGPSDLSTEFSVDYFIPYKEYMMIYHNDQASDRLLRSSVICRWSDSPLGPWSEPQLLYTPPEVVEHEEWKAYAIKGHYPYLSDNEKDVVVSYVLRSETEEETLSDPELYVPYFVKMTFMS
jgi:hypothetical protein